jgi:hypothetical protein
MKYYLHIGLMKTGTTTLQEFFHLNSQKLQKQGYTIHKSAGRKDNYMLAVSCWNLDRRNYITKLKGITSNQGLADLQAAYIKKLQKELSKCTTENFVFICEFLQPWLSTQQEIRRFRDLLKSFGNPDIKVVVYLREPSSFANSAYSENVKWDAITQDMTSEADIFEVNKGPTLPDSSKHFINYRLTLEAWADVFGKANIIPRIFSRSDLKNGSVIDDFLDCLDIEYTTDLVIPKNANEGLSHTGIEILRRINKRLPRLVDDRISSTPRDIVDYIIRYYGGGKYVMPSDLSQHYRKVYSESNEWVRQNWFPDRETLFEMSDLQEPTTSEIPEKQLDLIANLISDIWIDAYEHPWRVLRKSTKAVIRRSRIYVVYSRILNKLMSHFY